MNAFFECTLNVFFLVMYCIKSHRFTFGWQYRFYKFPRLHVWCIFLKSECWFLNTAFWVHWIFHSEYSQVSYTGLGVRVWGSLSSQRSLLKQAWIFGKHFMGILFKDLAQAFGIKFKYSYTIADIVQSLMDHFVTNRPAVLTSARFHTTLLESSAKNRLRQMYRFMLSGHVCRSRLKVGIWAGWCSLIWNRAIIHFP